MGFVEKYKSEPFVFSRKKLDEIAARIRRKKIPYYEYTDSSDKNYFCCIFSPDGKLIEPTKIANSHPEMTDLLILPEDYLLNYMIHNIFRIKYNNNILRAYLASMDGYIQISGSGPLDDYIYKCLYNPFALNYKGKLVTDTINFGKNEMNSISNSTISGENQLEDAIKVPFFKNQFEKKMEERGITPNEINKLFKSDDERRQYIRNLNDRFNAIIHNIEKILNRNCFKELATSGEDIYTLLLETLKCSPQSLLDTIENFDGFDNSANRAY